MALSLYQIKLDYKQESLVNLQGIRGALQTQKKDQNVDAQRYVITEEDNKNIHSLMMRLIFIPHLKLLKLKQRKLSTLILIPVSIFDKLAFCMINYYIMESLRLKYGKHWRFYLAKNQKMNS